MKPLLLMITLCLAGCAMNNHADLEFKQPQSIIHWEESMIREYSFNSLSDTGILYLGFPESGNHVLVTIGDRNDAIASPVWRWTIDHQGKLILTDYDERHISTLKLVSLKGADVEVWDGRSTIRYTRTKKN